MSKETQSIDENVIVSVNNQVANEKLLLPLQDINLLVFQCLFTTFSSALLLQIISTIPIGYKLQDFGITLLLFVFGAFVVVLVLNKKIPTLKFYLLFAACFIGLIIGV